MRVVVELLCILTEMAVTQSKHWSKLMKLYAKEKSYHMSIKNTF